MVPLESFRGVGSLELELQMIMSYLNCEMSHLSNQMHLNFLYYICEYMKSLHVYSHAHMQVCMMLIWRSKGNFSVLAFYHVGLRN